MAEEEEEEEEEVVSDAVARLINDVSPTLTHIDDLPGKEFTLNTLNTMSCYVMFWYDIYIVCHVMLCYVMLCYVM